MKSPGTLEALLDRGGEVHRGAPVLDLPSPDISPVINPCGPGASLHDFSREEATMSSGISGVLSTASMALPCSPCSSRCPSSFITGFHDRLLRPPPSSIPYAETEPSPSSVAVSWCLDPPATSSALVAFGIIALRPSSSIVAAVSETSFAMIFALLASASLISALVFLVPPIPGLELA